MNYLLTTVFLVLHILPCHAQQVASYPDNSFTVEEYIYLNIPAPDKTWDEADLKKFIKYMEKIQVEDKWSLPRKDSPYSGDLFSKMVDIANLSPIIDKSISIESRLKSIETHTAYSNFLIALYKEDNRKIEGFGREVLAALRYLVYTARNVRLLLDELKSELPENSAQNRDFKNMHNNSTEQLAHLMSIILLTFEKDAKRYDYSDLSNFAEDAYQTILGNWSLITQTEKGKLMAVINRLQTHSNIEVARKMKTLYKELGIRN
jgi:hypothetical protein